MWYCKIVDGAINCFANSDNVAIGDDMIRLPEGLDPNMAMLVVDDDGTFSLTTDPTKVQARLDAQWTSVRTQRNQLLAQSDWTALSDAHLSQDKKDAWFTYRQALRDLPDEVTDPTHVDWPLDPTVVVQAPVSGSRLTGILGQV